MFVVLLMITPLSQKLEPPANSERFRLSQQVEFGTRIARFGADLKEFIDHVGADKVDICGWSMGASVVWSYMDLFGTDKIRKAAFIDEPVSIYTHAD